MKLLRVAIACSVLGLAGWAAPAVADPAPVVVLAQYAPPPPFRGPPHRHWRRRYMRHHRWVYVY